MVILVCTSFSQSFALAVDKCDIARVTVDVLPDLALLRMFDFYLHDKQIEAWCTLVHVCRKWRGVVFGSPRRLNLRLYCDATSQVKGRLAVWPPLPIVVHNDGYEERGVRSIVAALEHNDRVCGIEFCWYDSPWDSRSSSQMEKVLAAMRRPFPALTNLIVQAEGKAAAAVPASFLGGSAPELRKLVLCRIPFLALPKLVVSATHLVDLELLDIPDSGYFPPEAMATSLSGLTRLERFRISFESPGPHPGQKSRRPFPQTRTLLPVLTGLWFGGVPKYLEVLMAHIDAPLLNELYMSFSTFDTPQLTPFISRLPKSKAHNEANVVFFSQDVVIRLPRTFEGALELEITCEEPEEPVSWMAQLCSSSLPQVLVSKVEHLYILRGELSYGEDSDFDIEDNGWLELLRPFISVKRLYIQSKFEHNLTPVLRGLVGESMAEVLPALQTIFFQDSYGQGRFKQAIGPLVAERRLSGHPITVAYWDGIVR